MFKPDSIDTYIAGFPKDVQKKLQQIRAIIRQTSPDAVEAIKYGIPTFTLYGNMLSFAAYKNHIGLYPAPPGDAAFEKELAVYKSGKNTVQFPLDKPIPIDLVKRLVQFREIQQRAKAERKK